MRKAFALCIALIMMFQIPMVVMADEDTMKKVIIHYYRIDGNYDEVGVWTWNNGTNGSADGIAKTDVDAFGAVIELNVNIADADPTGHFIPLSIEVPENTTSFPPSGDGAKDSYNNMDLTYDRTALIEGDIDELHLFFIEGNDTAFTTQDERSMFNKEGFGTLAILYYHPSSSDDEGAYDQWDFWTWNAGEGGTGVFDGDNAIGVPFQWELKQDGKVFKVGVVNVAPDAEDQVGFIAKKGNWEEKGTPEDIMIDVTNIKGEGFKLVMYTHGDEDITIAGADLAFVPYKILSHGGTFAVSTTEIALEFSLPVHRRDAMKDRFIVADTDGNQMEIESVEYDIDVPTTYKIHLSNSNPLDKTKSYTLHYDELSIDVPLDNSPPVINYTKRQDYVLNKGDDFGIEHFIRISAIDDRSGNLTDVIVVEGEVNTKKTGTYTLTYKATDEWGNVGSESFVFTVTESSSDSMMIFIYAAGGIVLIGLIIAVAMRSRKNKSKTV